MVKIAIYASLICNFGLCVIQCRCFNYASTIRISSKCQQTFHLVYAAISSVSLSLLATGIDSVFDFGSNVLLFWLHRKAAKLDLNKWPVGGARLETIGNVVYGLLWTSSIGLRAYLYSDRIFVRILILRRFNLKENDTGWVLLTLLLSWSLCELWSQNKETALTLFISPRSSPLLLLSVSFFVALCYLN